MILVITFHFLSCPYIAVGLKVIISRVWFIVCVSNVGNKPQRRVVSLISGHRLNESKLFSTNEILASGRSTAMSSKSRDGSLWTPASVKSLESTQFSPFRGNTKDRQFCDSSPASRNSAGTEERPTFPPMTPVNREDEPAWNNKAKTKTDPFELSPIVRHLLRGSMYMSTSLYEQNNKRLIASIASDVLAGRPFETYLNSTYAFGSLVFLIFLNDLEEYLRMDAKATDSVGRNKRQVFAAAILKQYRLAPSANHSMFPADEQKAVYLSLSYGTNPQALIRAQERCIQVKKKCCVDVYVYWSLYFAVLRSEKINQQDSPYG